MRWARKLNITTISSFIGDCSLFVFEATKVNYDKLRCSATTIHGFMGHGLVWQKVGSVCKIVLGKEGWRQFPTISWVRAIRSSLYLTSTAASWLYIRLCNWLHPFVNRAQVSTSPIPRPHILSFHMKGDESWSLGMRLTICQGCS